jgi:hypothetical protein
MNRVLTAGRLQIVHPSVILGMPWLIGLSSFVINWAFWRLTGVGQEPNAFTGGILSLYITVSVVFVQAVTQLLPLAMGLSLSRRTYWLGVASFAVASAVTHGIVLALLAAVESATDGWGVGLQFWVPEPLRADDVALQVLVSGAPMLAFAFIGIGIGVIFKRWGASGVWGLTVGTLLVLGGLGGAHDLAGVVAPLGSWLADQSVVTLAVGLPLAVAAVVAALTFAGIRRVVP